VDTKTANAKHEIRRLARLEVKAKVAPEQRCIDKYLFIIINTTHTIGVDKITLFKTT